MHPCQFYCMVFTYCNLALTWIINQIKLERNKTFKCDEYVDFDDKLYNIFKNEIPVITKTRIEI